MLKSHIVLGLSTLGSDISNIVHAITVQDYTPYPLGCPMIICAQDAEKRNSVTNGLVLISPNNECASGTVAVNYNTVKEVKLRPLIPNHKVVTIFDFDPNRIGRLIEYVNDIGIISLIITNKPSIISFISKNLYELTKYFKYHTITTFNNLMTGNKFLQNDKDLMLGVLTLIDIRYCIPIFNPKKVDGIGVNFSIVTKVASETWGRLHKLADMDMLLSNYKDNAFIVDGSVICEPYQINPEITRVLKAVANTNLEIHAGKSRKHDELKSLFKSEYNMPPPWEKLEEVEVAATENVKNLNTMDSVWINTLDHGTANDNVTAGNVWINNTWSTNSTPNEEE